MHLFYKTISITCLLFVLPLQVHAAANDPITRGDFLQLLVQELRVPVDASLTTTKFKRVPSSLIPIIETLHNRDALRVFNTTIAANRFITRIEAIRIVVELLRLQSTKQVHFRDVRRGTLEQQAVQVAIERGFMPPMRTGFFGADRLLTQEQATVLVLKASGRSVPVDPITNKPIGIDPTEARITIQAPIVINPSSYPLPKEQLQDIVWQLLQEDYLYADQLEETKAGYAAIEAVVSSANDPYTTFMRPQDAQKFQTQIAGEVTGIGAQVQEIDGFVTVVSPLPSSPAARAGIQPNDRIIAVDGTSITDLSFTEAVNKIRGPRGSTAEFTIQRNGLSFQLTIERDLVRIPDFETNFNGKIAIVTLMQFGQATNRDLTATMKELMAQNPTGLILDLRNNPGGLLEAAGIVVGEFVPKGTVYAKIKSKNGTIESVTTIEPTIPSTLKVVVLANGGSASSSEIVIGALRDLGRAKIVGTKTFGKGTVQQVIQFSDTSSLKFTVAEWLTPNGRKIDKVGIEPDYNVEFSQDRDEALLKAINLLQ